MKLSIKSLAVLIAIFASAAGVYSQNGVTAKMPVKPAYDAELARRLGGDKNGMKLYVIAFLKTGPKVIPEGKERNELFAGHMANIGRLAEEGKLAVAGPFVKNDAGFRGIFILNVETIEDARKLVETDPVVKSGVMVVELYKWYGSASLMATPEIHKKIEAPSN